jgi:hypothetical protein
MIALISQNEEWEPEKRNELCFVFFCKWYVNLGEWSAVVSCLK